MLIITMVHDGAALSHCFLFPIDLGFGTRFLEVDLNALIHVLARIIPPHPGSG